MRATLLTVGSNFYKAQISQLSKIFQFRVFAISSVFELDTSSFGFWAFFHVSLGVLFQNWSKLQNLSVLVSLSGGQPGEKYSLANRVKVSDIYNTYISRNVYSAFF